MTGSVSRYTPERLAELTEEDLVTHYYDNLCDLGPGKETSALAKEAERRGLDLDGLTRVYAQAVNPRE
jgi:hypothetical protein